jgi:hypothetical protein
VDLDDPESVKRFDCHHEDPEEKDYPISRLPSLSWKVLKRELKKCVLLCRRCHMVKYHGWLPFSNEDDRMGAAFDNYMEDHGDVHEAQRSSETGRGERRGPGVERHEEPDDAGRAAPGKVGREDGEAGTAKEGAGEANPLPKGQGSQSGGGPTGPAQESCELEVVPF